MACIARVGCFVVNRLNDIVPAVKCLIAYQLYYNATVRFPDHGENGNILAFFGPKGNTQYNVMCIALNIIYYLYIIYITVIIQVKVIDS